MADNTENQHETAGAWAKRYYFAQRNAMDSVLRPYGLGSSQWYVLYQLANNGPTLQRDLGRMLHIERATLSGLVATLVGKGLVDQVADSTDQRQRMLKLSEAGTGLWQGLPDPVGVIRSVSWDGVASDQLAVTIAVLEAATKRLYDHDWGVTTADLAN